MRYLLIIINIIAVIATSCKESCYNIQCGACRPFESSGTIIFEFDSTLHDSFWVYQNPMTTDSSYITYPLNSLEYKIPFDKFGYYKKIGITDKSRTWQIGETKFHRTKGEDCCDCGTETILEITINDTLYSRAQLPLKIK